jgi:hypothetical protein
MSYSAQKPHISELCLQLFNALLANSASVKKDDIIYVIAEDAGRLILLQNDTAVIYKNFQ